MKCAVITPIGPGHRDIYNSVCLPSIHNALKYNQGPFELIEPFGLDDSKALHGRSNRRNEAVRQCKPQGFDWVFFLDADDQLTPNAFEAFGRCLEQAPQSDAIWGLICESDNAGDPSLREDQKPEIASFEAFLASPPWLAVQIGCFLRIDVASAVKFDETMDAGEDYKFFLELWSTYACRKFPEIFFINNRGQHSQGARSATGTEWQTVVEKLWTEKVAEHPVWASVALNDIHAKMRINNPLDIIQATHLSGSFFDDESLESLQKLGLSKPRIVDVGANVGNHSIWFCKAMDAEKVYPVEPNPAALSLLKANLTENGLDEQIDRRGFGFGLGNGEGRFNTRTIDQNNLGATTLEQDSDGDIPVVTLDKLMDGEKADLVKIDAEGMELDVLEGAAGLIAASRPIILVEVLRKNQLDFAQRWCKTNRYCLSDAWFYVNTVDYLAVPEERF